MYPLTIGLLIQDRRLSEEVEGVLLELPVRNVLDENELGDWSSLLERIEALQPDVFILDISRLADPPEEAVRRIRETSARPIVIVIDDEMRPQRILQVMRAGATEYLYPPAGQGLVRALQKASDEVSRLAVRTDNGNKVIGVFSSKGGSGGTTVSCHLASELADRTNQKTLVIDLDLRGGLVSFLLRGRNDRSLLDLTRNLYRLDQSYWGDVISNGRRGLSVISAPSPAAGESPTVDQLRQILSFARTIYPWTILDLGSGLSPLTMQLMADLDRIFMVTTLEITALHRAKQIAKELQMAGLGKDRFQVVLNRAPRSPELTNEELEKMLGVPIYKSIPNDYPTLYEAYSERQLAPEKSRIRKEFARFASKLAGLETPKKKFSLFG